MKMKILILLFMLFSQTYFINTGCGSDKDKPYEIKYVNKVITVDGVLEKKEWRSANPINGLYAPWDTVGYDKTFFRSFRSDRFFYFCFDVHDPIIITHNFENELTVAREDRVELFFSATSDMSQYYCIEMDPLGRILDYSARYYREFDERWDFDNVIIATNYTRNGYVLEGCIPLKVFEKLEIKDSFLMGVFRADFFNDKADDIIWYTWIDPDSKSPDFHIPSSLGKCIFVNPRSGKSGSVSLKTKTP